jgi:tRNA 2-thiouridine synthesizing protein A
VSDGTSPERPGRTAAAAPAVTEVDARGLSCPMPVIELAKAVRDVGVGEVVLLLATDPAAKVDVPVWCRMQRQTLRTQDEHEGVWRFAIERAR